MDQQESPDVSASEATSQEFFGRWQRLVSTTNWEKGRIIFEWRRALIEAEAESSEYSDEAWSRRVGSVTPQHVGRLRRAYERFGQVAEEYPQLYWSHFQAALDWNDAEMWLEGAIANSWSVSRMRHMRWDAHGAPADLKPREEDVITAEFDEDFSALETDASVLMVGSPEVVREPTDVSGASEKGAGDPASQRSADSTAARADSSDQSAKPGSSEQLDLEGWPDDLADALEQFKLAIVRHKMAGWTDVAPEEVLSALRGLEEIVRSGNQ